ncbi:MAG: hypothetical protein R2774_12265 [Saprospiraceae bacterium]
MRHLNISSLNSYFEIVLYLGVITLLIFTSQNILFWDTVQFAGKHSLYFYEHFGVSIILPNDIDSGHIPVFGYYLAALFKVFGVSLDVAHWAMLPFLFGIIFFVFRISELLFKKPEERLFLVVLLLSDPTLLTQSILVSPDIALMCFFSMTFYGIVSNNPLWKWVGVIGLSLISLRGAMVVFVLFIMDVVYRDIKGFRIFQIIWPYLIGGTMVFAYFMYHYYVKGWIGIHSDSPWYNSFYINDFTDFPKQLALLLWRILDFGRIGLWLIVVLVMVVKKHQWPNLIQKNQSMFIWLSLGLLMVLGIHFFIYRGVNAHRYLLPFYFSSTILAFSILRYLVPKMVPKLMVIIVLSLWTGHFWVYPDHISQGWDGSLAHVPYYKLRDDMLKYLDSKHIPLESVGSQFPNVAESRYIELNLNANYQFKPADVFSDQYILYSNVYNDFTDNDRKILSLEYELIYSLKREGVKLELYKRVGRN